MELQLYLPNSERAVDPETDSISALKAHAERVECSYFHRHCFKRWSQHFIWEKIKKKSKDNSPDGSAAQKCTENNGEKHFHNYDSAYGKVSFRVTEKFPGLDA